MSLASSKKLASAEPTYDLNYSIHDFPPVDGRPDTTFLYRRIDDVMVQEGAVPGGRALDVACGLGKLVVNLHQRGMESWGLDPSHEMLGLSSWVFPREKLILARGIAEVLPFRDAGFDRIVCQGSLDHFVEPQAFMREAARVLRPDGRLVIALANYESLACRIGRFREALGQDGHPGPRGERPYWVPPSDHYQKGDLRFIRKLGRPWLRLERCYGISLLWLVKDWDKRLERLPGRLAAGLLSALDRIAYWTPSFADLIISVWRPRAAEGDAR